MSAKAKKSNHGTITLGVSPEVGEDLERERQAVTKEVREELGIDKLKWNMFMKILLKRAREWRTLKEAARA